jgi:putative two-component system response regulator
MSNTLIVVVDDSPTILRDVSERIAGAYADLIELVPLRSGREALSFCRKRTPNLILLDIEMPDMNGLEVLKELIAHEATAGIPVIMLTARHDLEAEAEAFEHGAVDFIVKPFATSTLLHRIETRLTLSQYRHHLEDSLRIVEDSIIASFTGLLESRDSNTAGHARRTSRYLGIIGLRCLERDVYKNDLNLEILHMMVRAAPLHDIGKVGMPDNVLLKPGKLTDEEALVMQNHPRVGAHVLESMLQRTPDQEYLKYAVLIAEYHHEKFGGGGYPNGVSGEKIPACARIMAIADVYDALTSDRVYRPAMPHEKAVEIILEGREVHFDPVALDAFIEVEQTLKETLEASRLKDTTMVETLNLNQFR